MPKGTTLPNATQAGAPSGAGTVAASLAAIGSLLVASGCCLPILPLMMAAGLAGTSAFLSEIRPYLLGGSILSIALAFYQARRARKCDRRTNTAASILLWVIGRFGVDLDLFPADHGKRNRWAVI